MRANTRCRDSGAGSGFAALVAGYGVSTFGNFLNLIALNLFVFHITGSALVSGLAMALRLGCGVAAGMPAGVLAGRVDRRLLMIGSDLAQAAVMGALAVSADAVGLVGLACVVVVMGAANTVHQVSLRTSVPEIVGADRRQRANGVLVTAKSIAMVAGFSSAGLVVDKAGFAAAFAVNAGSFLFSAAATTRVRMGPPTRSADAPKGTGRLVPLLAAVLVLRGMDAFGSSAHNVALPVVATAVAPDAATAYMSWFWTAWGIGSLLAHNVVARLARDGLGERAFAIGTCVMSVGFASAFAPLPVVLVAAAALVAGVADGVTEIAFVSRLQAEPEQVRARLFGAAATAETTGFAVGMASSGALLEVWSPLGVVGVFHGATLVAAVVFLAARRGLAARGSA